MKRFASITLTVASFASVILAVSLLVLHVGAADAQNKRSIPPQTGADKAETVVDTPNEPRTTRQSGDPREVAEAYIAAVLAGNTRAAAALATGASGTNNTAALPTRIDEFRTSLLSGHGLRSLPKTLEIERVWSDGIAGRALAVSQRTTTTVGNQFGRSGRVVLQIYMDGGRWVIQDVENMFEPDADKIIARFHQQHPDAREIPYVRVSSTPRPYRQRDDEARQTAQAYLKHLERFGSQSPKLRDLKAALSKAVAAAFEARQQHQRSELAKLQQRFRRIQDLIESRERIKDKIIDHRVEELLNPNLQWELNGQADVSPESNRRKLTGAAGDAAEVGAAVDVEGPAQSSLAEFDVRRVTELRTTIETLAEEARSYEAVLKYNPKADNIGNIANELRTARRKLAIHRDELAAQIQLLELELEDAQSAANAAAKASESDKQSTQSQRDAEAAQLRVDRLRTLLELYRKVEPPENEKADGRSTE